MYLVYGWGIQLTMIIIVMYIFRSANLVKIPIVLEVDVK